MLHIVANVYRKKKPEYIKGLVLTAVSKILQKSLNISLPTCVMTMIVLGIAVTQSSYPGPPSSTTHFLVFLLS